VFLKRVPFCVAAQKIFLMFCTALEFGDKLLFIISASLFISMASGELMLQNIRMPHLSVRKSELWQTG